jgi:hypothetical protein
MSDTRTATDVIISHLETETTLNVGDSQAPGDTTRPYLVVYNTGAAIIDGTLSDADADQSVEYQVTSVGDTSEQAEWAQSLPRTAMTVAITPPSGASWGAPRLQPAVGTSRDDTYQPPLFYAVDVYRIHTTPS